MCRNRLPPCETLKQLHAHADAEHRQAPLGGDVHQPAVEILAALLQQPHRGVQHEAVAARVEIGAADQHQAVQQVEHAIEVVLVGQRGNDDRDPSGLGDAVEVAGAEIAHGRGILLGRAIVCVQSDQRLDTLHGSLPFRTRHVSHWREVKDGSSAQHACIRREVAARTNEPREVAVLRGRATRGPVDLGARGSGRRGDAAGPAERGSPLTGAAADLRNHVLGVKSSTVTTMGFFGFMPTLTGPLVVLPTLSTVGWASHGPISRPRTAAARRGANVLFAEIKASRRRYFVVCVKTNH